MRDPFATFIISHQRPHSIPTIDAYRRAGYTGDLFIVVDDKDPTLEAYRERFGDQLIVFSKDEVEPEVDTMDPRDNRQSSVYVRNKIWDIAEDMGLTYFFLLDDDYDWFRWRIGPRGQYLHSPPWIDDMDAVLEAMMRFMDKAPITSLCFSQGGDWIGGENSTHADGVMTKRKAMNAYLLRTDRRFSLPGRMNEDVTAYVLHGNRGLIFLTFFPTALNQESQQEGKGGMSGIYHELGTYTKSFYTVMAAPSCTKISAMGENYLRLHHRITWRNAVPKIISDSYQKPRS